MDTSKEEIYLKRTESSLTPDVLPQVVPDGAPRYHFFVFKHSFEGDYQEAVGMYCSHQKSVRLQKMHLQPAQYERKKRLVQSCAYVFYIIFI